MKNNKIIHFSKQEPKKEREAPMNEQNELVLKQIELYEPMTFEQIQKINKKKYRDLKIEKLKNNFSEALWYLNQVIGEYKELKNRTEFWEEESTYNYDFKSWNTIRKATTRLTRYYNELLLILKKI